MRTIARSVASLGLTTVVSTGLIPGCGESRPTGPAPVADASPIGHLTNEQYAHTVRDLFPGVPMPEFDLPVQFEAAGGFENNTVFMGPTAPFVETQARAALAVSEALSLEALDLACAAEDPSCAHTKTELEAKTLLGILIEYDPERFNGASCGPCSGGCERCTDPSAWSKSTHRAKKRLRLAVKSKPRVRVFSMSTRRPALQLHQPRAGYRKIELHQQLWGHRADISRRRAEACSVPKLLPEPIVAPTR